MSEERPNVVLLVIDACRADVLSPYDDGVERTPEIEQFSEDATVFRRAISPAPWTLPSVTSLLTGRYPHEHGANSRRFELQRGRTITADLSAAGYRCLHLSPKTWIGDWLPQGRGFDRVEEFTGPTHRYFDGGEDMRSLSEGVARGPEWYATVARRALASSSPLRSLGNALAFRIREATGDAWLDNVRASERAARIADERFAALADRDEPFFTYVHLMNPHLPFYVPPEHRTDDVRPPGCEDHDEEVAYMDDLMDDIWAVRTGERRLSEAELDYLRTRYRDEVAYADAAVGRILGSLRRHGLADDTLVALTGDHGEHLGERVDGRTMLDHQASVSLPVLRVPLVVRYPGTFDGSADESLVQPHYLAETVRALAGREYDETRSLLPADRDARRGTALAEYAGVVPSHPPEGVEDDALFASRRSAVAGDWKLDEVDGERRAARIDWTANEATEVDVEEIPDDARAALMAALDGREASAAAGERDVPDAVERNLSELGYL